ncbi:MAG: transcriptional repressor LexA [Rhizomicrobium sp.]
MLTRKQYELLMFIHERVRETGIPPSFDEMKDALDLKSKSGIHRLITALEERGFLKRMEKRARAIEIIKLPDNIAETVRPAVSRNQVQRMSPPRQPRGDARTPENRPSENRLADTRVGGTPRHTALEGDSISVPLVGKIAAGIPIEALQNKVADIPVPAGMIGSGDHYALEVAGDSMINAGILDGDTVIIRHVDTANNGDIVVALIGGTEATLKRLRRHGASIALEAANPAYETRLYGADQVQVQGRLVGLLRHY